MKQKILFIDRDGTLIIEPAVDYQVDSFSKLEFYPHVIEYLNKIATRLDYELVMVTNQDGLGTDSFPEKDFKGPHEFMLKTFENERIHFSKVFIDSSLPSEKKTTRKPGTGMLVEYLNNSKYDLLNSYVIGDRITDVLLAKNLGCSAIFLGDENDRKDFNGIGQLEDAEDIIALKSKEWKDVYEYLELHSRMVHHHRHTNETDVDVKLNLDGSGKSDIHTGVHFFDHMLDQLARHGGIDLFIKCDGDLEVDDHHTIEDTAITLGEAFATAMGNKRGMARYGFLLPMDDSLAQVTIDFGGRNWIVWDAEFKRERIGDMPTEMFFHFFKSFSDAAKCNINISVRGDNEHHKIESVFKAFAKAIRMAVKRDFNSDALPTTKGMI